MISIPLNEHLRALLEEPRVKLLRSSLAESELFLVGGALRSIFYRVAREERNYLGDKDLIPAIPLESPDLDFACSLAPEVCIERLERSGIHAVMTNPKHLTVTAVPVEGLKAVEITSFRMPVVEGHVNLSVGPDIFVDLSYRDLTVNALALNCKTGELIDPWDGIGDLQAGILRSVRSPRERFGEDPLRILRLVRFLCELGFSAETETYRAALELAPQLLVISVERIRDEFSKILLSPRPSLGFALLIELGILQMFLPEVEAFVDFEQNQFHKADLFQHTLEVVSNTYPDLVLRLAALFHDVGKPSTLSTDETGFRHFYKHETIGADMTTDILLRLRYSKQIVKEVSELVRLHMRPLDCGPGGMRRLIRDTGPLFDLWRALKEADARACKIDSDTVTNQLRDFDVAIAEVRKGPQVSPLASLAINGTDLLELGISEGPLIGVILRALHELVLDDPSLNERSALIDKAKEIREMELPRKR